VLDASNPYAPVQVYGSQHAHLMHAAFAPDAPAGRPIAKGPQRDRRKFRYGS